VGALLSYRWFILFLLIVSTLLTPVKGNAEETLSFALFSRGWAPFEMMDQDVPRGLAVDLFFELMPDDLDKKIVPMPRPRKALHAMTFPMFTRLEAKKWMKKSYGYWWSEPVLTLKNVLYSSSEKPLEFEGMDSLHNKRIGCIRNYFYPAIQPLFDSSKAVRYDVNSDIVLLRMVKAGRVDAAVFDAISAQWLIKNASDLHFDDFFVSENEVDSVDLRFVFNFVPDWEKRMQEINYRIRQKREDGTIERLKSDYK